MAPGQINLKEMGPEQIDFGQMSTTKKNALRNGFCTQYLKSHSPTQPQNKCAAVNRLNCFFLGY